MRTRARRKMYQRDWPYTEMRPPRGDPSPLQKRGIRKTWHAPTTQDFLRQLRWRSGFGGVYAIVGDGDQADIVVRSARPGDDRWIRLFTYPAIGLRAMRESGLLPMERVAAIPDFDAGAELWKTEASRRWWGEDPEFWLVRVPGVTDE